MANFTLNVSTLGGLGFGFAETIFEDRGRGIVLTWEQEDKDAGLELFGYTLRFYAAEPESKEVT